jgi:hypothetical protein
MTRAQACLGLAIFGAAVAAPFVIPQTTTAQAQPACADRSRQTLAIRMAREINSQQTSAHQRTNVYQPMDAFPALNAPG